MTVAAGPGILTIRAALSDGYVRRAQISSTRPLVLSRLFVGRPAAEAPVLAGSLFSLCGFSHAVAASLAIGNAKAQAVLAENQEALTRGILAERVAEYLRSLVIGWSDNQGATPVAPNLLMVLRDALAAARELTALPLGRQKDDEGGRGAVSRLVSAARRLGSADDPATTLGQMLKRAKAEEAFLVRSPDALGPEDDDEVVAGLRRDGLSFSAMPTLAGRVAETGAFARHFSFAAQSDAPHCGKTPMPNSAIAARLMARLADLAATVDALEAGNDAHLWSSGRSGEGQGYGAVESPRGRLYHWVALDDRGIVQEYAIVAPTEWNFHPNGPFIRTLLGAKVGEGVKAERRVSWLAAMFDPCVAFRVVLAEDEAVLAKGTGSKGDGHA